MSNAKQGRTVQDEFEARWQRCGKNAWLHRLKDASDLYGRNKRLVVVDDQPADFVAAFDHWFGMVEVKSTTDDKGFSVSLIRRGQMIAATRCIASKVPYVFAIKSLSLREWFFVPAGILIYNRGKVKWSSLLPYTWPEDSDAPLLALHGRYRNNGIEP